MPELHPDVCVSYLCRTDADGGRRVLLGTKRRGLGEGRVVAPGGKLEPGESPADAAAREVEEEVGIRLDPSRFVARGRLDYVFPHRPSWSQRSWVFVVDDVADEPTPSDELSADWVPVAEVPYGRMWDDARLWLPGVLAGGDVSADVEFGSDLASVVAVSGTGIDPL